MRFKSESLQSGPVLSSFITIQWFHNESTVVHNNILYRIEKAPETCISLKSGEREKKNILYCQ